MKVSHIAITVSNIEVSKKFYIDNFGFTFVKSFAKPGSGAQFMYLEKDNFQIELWEFEQLIPNNGGLEALNVIGLRHLAFSVPNVSETVTLLVAAGYNFSAPVVGSSGKEYSLGQDPDGIALEIIAE